jgi:hypothetical protein
VDPSARHPSVCDYPRPRYSATRAILYVVASRSCCQGEGVWQFALGVHPHSAWHLCGDSGTPFGNSKEGIVREAVDHPPNALMTAPWERPNRKRRGVA